MPLKYTDISKICHLNIHFHWVTTMVHEGLSLEGDHSFGVSVQFYLIFVLAVQLAQADLNPTRYLKGTGVHSIARCDILKKKIIDLVWKSSYLRCKHTFSNLTNICKNVKPSGSWQKYSPQD